jgi:hypothetical protein
LKTLRHPKSFSADYEAGIDFVALTGRLQGRAFQSRIKRRVFGKL